METKAGLTLPTRFPGDEDIEDPDTSEAYEDDDDATDPINDADVLARLKAAGFNVKRLRQAWGDGSKLQ